MWQSLPGVSITSISGGGNGHCLSVVREKKKRNALEKVKVVVLVCGGNDISERGPDGVAKMVMSLKEVFEWMETMVKWLRKEMPAAEIRTADFIPRDSTGGRFTMAARNWSSRVLQVDGQHRHFSLWRIFVNEPRSWKLKAGKGNRKTAPWTEKAEQGPPEDLVRFELRSIFYNCDRVHLSDSGKRVLTEIFKWQLTETPEETKDISTTVIKDGERVPFKCRAFFKF